MVSSIVTYECSLWHLIEPEQSEVNSSRTSLAPRTSSRAYFEVLGFGLEAQVLGFGLELYKSSKMPCPRLEDSIVSWLVEKKITKHKNFLNSGISVARIFDWKAPIRKSHAIWRHQKFSNGEVFLWDKNILEWKIRSLVPGLARKQDVAKGGGLEPKVNVFKYVLNFIVEAR